ncbi:MAG: hypothetical protein IPK35_01490 [Saprospiraceae bacterium]|jgi:hypothetical protein|nr:hypothetical protein [Saprospiraceae bacterium]
MRNKAWIILLFISTVGFSQSKEYESFRKLSDILLAHEGKWMTTNTEFDATSEWSAI